MNHLYSHKETTNFHCVGQSVGQSDGFSKFPKRAGVTLPSAYRSTFTIHTQRSDLFIKKLFLHKISYFALVGVYVFFHVWEKIDFRGKLWLYCQVKVLFLVFLFNCRRVICLQATLCLTTSFGLIN